MSSVVDDEDPWVALVSAGGIVVGSYLTGVLVSTLAVLYAGRLFNVSGGSPGLVALTMATQYSGFVAVAAVYVSSRERPWAFLRVRWPSLRDLGWTVGGVIFLFWLFVVASTVIGMVGVSLPSHSFLADAEPLAVLLLIPLSILITGPAEELVYRGVVQSRLMDAFGAVVAIGTAAMLFAVVHIPAYAVGTGEGSVTAAVLLVFVLGLGLGGLYEHTGNLFVPAAAHGLYNAVTFGRVYLEMTGGL